jgi:hypothetical protein
MIRKKRMSKGIAKILSGLLVFGMVAGHVPAVPGGTVHAKAAEISGPAEEHTGSHLIVLPQGATWTGINSLDNNLRAGYYYLTDNVELTETWTPQNNVVLCLNGKAVTMNADEDVILVDDNNHFTLCDCKDTGIVTHGTKLDGTTKYSGGGVDVTGIFTMYGGTICNNNSAYGGGVYIFSTGSLEMFGGKISENEASYGGGVCGAGQKVTMKGGIISNNTSKENGGGVYLASGTFDMSGGTITQNTSKALGGGGVYKAAGTFNMSGGAAIIDNTSTTLGGGVYNATGTFNMSGGEIKGNKSGTSGGGVYNAPDSSAKIIMSDQAEISNNQAASAGGGVFASQDNAITLSDAVKITENKVGNTANNLYLSSNTTLQAACLNGSEAIVGVTTETEPTENSPVTITSDDARTQGFRSDRDEYELECSNGHVVMKKKKTCTVEVYITKNVIKQQGSGELEQTVTEGSNIVPIVLEAATGYYFKDEDISKLNTASVKVTKLVDDGSRIQIECTPNNDIVISLLAFEKPAIEKPKIIKQPQPVSVKVGETATFTVEAAGEGLSYQWQIKAGKGGWDDITDANTSSYTTTAVVPNCNGFEYRCVVSNSAGSVNSGSATLTVDTTIPPTPEPNPEPKPEPTPNPEPAPNPTPDSAPATTTPAASTIAAPAASAPAQVTYNILDGAGSSWTQNTDGSLAIRGSGEISKFREVKVDGVTVDPVNYTVTEGSTIITFKPEYLKSLPAGNHSFELVWTDGTAATNFTVAENADQSAKSPKTGEDFSMALCTALLMVSCAGLAGIFVRRKKGSLR